METLPTADEELLTKQEVCQRMRLGDRTVGRWINEDGLPAHRLGRKILRFRWSEILAWLAADKERQKSKGKRQKAREIANSK